MSRVVPNRELGQHFLVDENILGVIGRLAELGPEDVVLEIGPGLGVLTGYLADRVARVHAVEIDRGLKPSLDERLAGRENVELIFGDALNVDLADVDPPPTKLVANLPYQVATPIVVESIDGLPTVERWCVMVQREVADRFFAQPSTKAYGAVSVLIQLAAERTDSTRCRRRSSALGRTSIRPSSRSAGYRSRRTTPGSKESLQPPSPTGARPSRIARPGWPCEPRRGLCRAREARPLAERSRRESSHRPSSSPWTAHCV